MPYGVSFLPSGYDDPTQNPARSRQRVQEAVKILSLRLPRVAGAASIAPAPLLQAEGAAGSPTLADHPVLRQLLAQLPPASPPPSEAPAGPVWAPPMMPSAAGPPPMMPSAAGPPPSPMPPPTPRIIPGALPPPMDQDPGNPSDGPVMSHGPRNPFLPLRGRGLSPGAARLPLPRPLGWRR